MTGLKKGIKSGNKRQVTCTVHGSRPPANISWSLEGKPDWKPMELFEVKVYSASLFIYFYAFVFFDM